MPEVKDKTTGQVIAKMPYDTAGKMAAEKMVAENPGYEIKDGAQRSEQIYAGGGQAGFNSIGNPMYDKGGEVEEKSFAEKEAERLPRWTAVGKTAADIGKALIGVPDKWKEMTDEAKKFYKEKFDEYKESVKKKKKKQTYNI